MAFKYEKAAIAGTFDRLHSGHKHFIAKSFELSKTLVIGITSDGFALSKRHTSENKIDLRIRGYDTRKSELNEYLAEKGFISRSETVKINDVYGPTIDDNDIEAIILTADTKRGGLAVNRMRKKKGLKPLELAVIPMLPAQDKKRISSTRIRLGEIDRWGSVFERSTIFGGKIPENLRLKLKKPLGILITGSLPVIREKVSETIRETDPVMVISVGDEATRYLNKLSKWPQISIVDFHIKRIKVHESINELEFQKSFYSQDYKNRIMKAVNPPGFITKSLVSAVKRSIQSFIMDGKRRVVTVTGEEDLAGIPAILLAPLGSLVFYGQPDQGIVAVEITEEKKKEILKMA